MIIQLANIIGGLVLSSGFISKRLGNPEADSFLKRMNLYQAEIGIGVLILGILALIERLGVISFSLYSGLHLGSSFPQAIPAILTGLILGEPLLRTIVPLEKLVHPLAPYKTVLGILSIVCGLGSLLFGCISPIGCPGGALYVSF